jgi:hypothetical protein
MLIYYHELPLEAGFNVLSKLRDDRLVKGRLVSRCSGYALFESIQHEPIGCWDCGCVADRWVADGQSQRGTIPPVLNLYGMRRGKLAMMTRDHIIPKSLGGKDVVENLRPGCDYCNSKRGNILTPTEIAFRAANPHLIDRERLEKGIKNAHKALRIYQDNERERERVLVPFEQIGLDIHSASYTALVAK